MIAIINNGSNLVDDDLIAVGNLIAGLYGIKNPVRVRASRETDGGIGVFGEDAEGNESSVVVYEQAVLSAYVTNDAKNFCKPVTVEEGVEFLFRKAYPKK